MSSQALFDYLGGDELLTIFLYDFPSVSREKAALLPTAFHVAPAQIDFSFVISSRPVKLLLDEQLPRRLSYRLVPLHNALTVQDMDWQEKWRAVEAIG